MSTLPVDVFRKTTIFAPFALDEMIHHPSSHTRFLLFVALFAMPLTLAGCASFGERHLDIRRDFEAGKLDEARSEIDKRLKKTGKLGGRGEEDVLKLNRAIIDLCSGNPQEAEKRLREVRDRFDEIERENVAKASQKSLSMLSDDNAVSYGGEDYEKVLIRVFLALANLMYDAIDTPAYALQIGQKQNDIIQKGAVKDPKDASKTINRKESYRQVAIEPYLIGALREETRRDYDDAVKAYETVCAWEPSFVQGKRDLLRAKRGRVCPNAAVSLTNLLRRGERTLRETREKCHAPAEPTNDSVSGKLVNGVRVSERLPSFSCLLPIREV